ncbi:MAG: GntR family transcriptional regulator [Oligosphaeraceae bacterium]|nr:GntR family transcriptional regulator [Oligosphaeraceae bacterium]
MKKLKNNQGNQTEVSKRKLICYIHDQKLREGDALPSQTVLRKLFGVGAFTIQRAISALEKDGILETIPHRAVRVKSLKTNGYDARLIGLVCLRRSYIPSSTILLQCLLNQLADQNCQCKLFLRNSNQMTDVDSLAHFDGLQRCIERGLIHGILTTVSFDDKSWRIIRDHHIPVVSMDTASHNKGCKVSFASILPQAYGIVKSRHLRRPALIHCGYPFVNAIRSEFKAYFPKQDEQYCRFLFPDMIEADEALPMANAAQKVLDDFCGMPEDLRPDVLIIPDDFIINYVYTELLKRRLASPSFHWQPHFIYIIQKQNLFFTPSEPIGDCFEFDIIQYAERAVQALHEKMTGSFNAENENITVIPHLVNAP